MAQSPQQRLQPPPSLQLMPPRQSMPQLRLMQYQPTGSTNANPTREIGAAADAVRRRATLLATLMANFWESFIDSGLQKPDDPGDSSMPYGPPLWSTPERSAADVGSYEPRGSGQWFQPQQLVPDPQQGYPWLPYDGPPSSSVSPWPQPQPDLSWATRSTDPFEVAARRVAGAPGTAPRAPARWPEFLANVIPSTLHYIDDLGNRMALSVQRMNDPLDGVFDPQPFVEAATMLYGTGGMAAMTPGMRGALGAAGGKYPLQPGWFSPAASIPAPRGLVRSDLAQTPHRPFEEMTATVMPTDSLQPHKTFDPAALQGGILTPAVGDRTAAGSILTHVNELPLSRPVLLDGGGDIMRSAANTLDGTMWAANKAAATKMANHARELGADGRDVYLVDSLMSARSGDSSNMMAGAVLGQLGNSPITRRAAIDFDARMAAKNPAWPGLMSPQLRDAVLSNPKLRKQLVGEMELGRHQTAGFPDFVSTRKAITEPALLGQPTGVSGYAVSKFDPMPRVIVEPTIPHSTYTTQVGSGQYMGGLEVPIPREVMFPDFFAKRRAADKPPRADDRAFSLGKVSQNADQQWLDEISQYIEQQKLLGR